MSQMESIAGMDQQGHYAAKDNLTQPSIAQGTRGRHETDSWDVIKWAFQTYTPVGMAWGALESLSSAPEKIEEDPVGFFLKEVIPFTAPTAQAYETYEAFNEAWENGNGCDKFIATAELGKLGIGVLSGTAGALPTRANVFIPLETRLAQTPRNQSVYSVGLPSEYKGSNVSLDRLAKISFNAKAEIALESRVGFEILHKITLGPNSKAVNSYTMTSNKWTIDAHSHLRGEYTPSIYDHAVLRGKASFGIQYESKIFGLFEGRLEIHEFNLKTPYINDAGQKINPKTGGIVFPF